MMLRPLALIVAGLVVLVGAVTACGGGAAPSVASIGTTTTPPKVVAAVGGKPSLASIAAGAAKYAACMRSHGVTNFPTPIIGPRSVQIQINPSVAGSPRFSTAQTACQHFMPGKPTAQQFSTQQQADYLKAANCMRSHGIAGFPDPVFPSAGQVEFPLPKGMDANSPQFEAARSTCEKLIPQGLPYSN